MAQKFIKIDANDEKFWIHMSVLEIRAQAQFAKMAYRNIKEKPGTGDEWATFSSIHSFLSHCAMISKMLQAKGPTTSIEQVLGIAPTSIINKRQFRNHLEHYDERLKKWIKKAPVGSSVVNHHIGSRKSFPVTDAIFVNFYDPFTKVFTFIDEDFDLSTLFEETKKILTLASKWLGMKEPES